jgi:hypothetical protein
MSRYHEFPSCPVGTTQFKCSDCMSSTRNLGAAGCWHDGGVSYYSMTLGEICVLCPSGCGPFRNYKTPYNSLVVASYGWPQWCVLARALMCALTFTCVLACALAYLCACMCTHLCAHARTITSQCTYSHKECLVRASPHTHTHTHTHTAAAATHRHNRMSVILPSQLLTLYRSSKPLTC